jgi:hypothetical protein
MTVYVVDTDILSLYQRNHPQVCTRIRLARQSNIIIKTTVITAEEQYGGRLAQIRKAQNSEALILAYNLLTATFSLFSQLEILKYDRLKPTEKVMKLANRNTDLIEPTPKPSIVQWTKLLLAIAAILTAASQVMNYINH